MHPLRTAAILVVLLVAGAGTMAVARPGNDDGDGRRATVVLRDAQGKRLGTVALRQHRRSGPVRVSARVRDMPPGFHGFHVHAVGRCEGPGFTSAMGHLKREGQEHGDHVGDLPVLLVNRDGSGRLVTETDRFDVADLRDGDGSAIIVHAGRDNYANIPTDRYDPDPDRTTLDTGDAGDRIACGTVR